MIPLINESHEIIASPFQPNVLAAYQGILGSANDLFNQAVTGIPLALQKLSDSLRTQQSQLQVAALPLVGNQVSDNFVYDFISKIKTPIQDALKQAKSTFNADTQDPLQVLQQAIKQGLNTAGFPEDVVKFTTLVDGVARSGNIDYTQGDIRLVVQMKNLSYEPEVKFNKVRDLLASTAFLDTLSVSNDILNAPINFSSPLTLSSDFGVSEIGLKIKPRTVSDVLTTKPTSLTNDQWDKIKDKEVKVSPYVLNAKVDDGVRLWVNGQQIINDWGGTGRTTSYSGTIALQQGQKYDLVMEYQKYTHDASAQLSWTPPGGKQEIIPATVFTPTLSGVKGEYFNGTNEIIQSNSLQLTKTDSTLDIAAFSPGNGVDTRNFAVRWTGLLNVTNAGDYQFHTTFNDGGRVWIDGQLVIDRWIDQFYSNRASSQKISLEEGQHNIQVEYFNDDRNSFFKSSSITLEWEGPNINRQVIPSDRLTSLGTQRVERGFLVEYFLPGDKAQLRPIFKRVETTMGVDRDQTLPQAIAHSFVSNNFK